MRLSLHCKGRFLPFNVSQGSFLSIASDLVGSTLKADELPTSLPAVFVLFSERPRRCHMDCHGRRFCRRAPVLCIGHESCA